MADADSDSPPSNAARVGRLAAWALALVIGLATAINTFGHDYHIGYDVAAHLAYAHTMADGHLPDRAESREFFTPPLGYAPAAVSLALGSTQATAARVWQTMQIASAAVVLGLIVLATRGRPIASIAALLFVAAGAVWWRSFAMLRPEAPLAALVVLGWWLTAGAFDGHATTASVPANELESKSERRSSPRSWPRFVSVRRGVGLGVPDAAMGRAGGARGRRLRAAGDGGSTRRWWGGALLAAAVCAVVAGPFYLSLHWRFGSVRSFNQPVSGDAALDWRLRPGDVVRAPTTPHLSRRPLDILLADVFGDYWLYYSVAGKSRNGYYVPGDRLAAAIEHRPRGFVTNAETMLPALRRASIAAMLAFALAAVAWGDAVVRAILARRSGRPLDGRSVLAAAMVLTTLAGYAWFVRTYTPADSDGDTVKATYLVQIWPLLAVLVGQSVDRTFGRWRGAWVGFVILFALVLALAGRGGGAGIR